MDHSHFQKTFTIVALLMLGGLAAAQELPRAPQLPQLLLEVDLKLEGGAALIRTRAITLDFTAREKGDGNVTIRDVTNS